MKIQDCSLEYLYRIYLMSSYLYYKEDKTKISDEMYDYICNVLHKHYNDFESEHKHLVSESDLAAGTGYALVYPNRVKWAALAWYADKEFTLEM